MKVVFIATEAMQKIFLFANTFFTVSFLFTEKKQHSAASLIEHPVDQSVSFQKYQGTRSPICVNQMLAHHSDCSTRKRHYCCRVIRHANSSISINRSFKSSFAKSTFLPIIKTGKDLPCKT